MPKPQSLTPPAEVPWGTLHPARRVGQALPPANKAERQLGRHDPNSAMSMLRVDDRQSRAANFVHRTEIVRLKSRPFAFRVTFRR